MHSNNSADVHGPPIGKSSDRRRGSRLAPAATSVDHETRCAGGNAELEGTEHSRDAHAGERTLRLVARKVEKTCCEVEEEEERCKDLTY